MQPSEPRDLRWLPPAARAYLAARPDLRRILGNTGWIVGENVLRLLVGLAIWVWIARYLGPERYGLLSYAMALVAITSSLASLGLEEIAVRELVRNPDRRADILGTIFGLKLGGGTAAFLAALAAVALLNPGDRTAARLVAILAAGLLFRSLDAFAFYFQSLVLGRYLALARGTATFLTAVAQAVLILLGAGLVAFAWAGLGEIAIASALLLLFFLRHAEPGTRKLRFSAATGRRLLGDSWPLIISGIMITIYMRIDQIMLEHMVGAEMLGKYAVAVRLSESWLFVPLAIVTSVYPKIIEQKDAHPALFERNLQRLFDAMAWLGYLSGLGALLLARPVISLLYGEPYQGAAGMLAILIWSGVFAALGIARSSYLALMGWTRFHLFSVTLGCLCNVLLNLYMIPRWQGVGAAVATLAAYCVAAYLSCFLYRPTRQAGLMMTRSLLPIPRSKTPEAHGGDAPQ